MVQVYFSGIGRLKNVKAALRRGRLLRCSLCNQPGATIGCRVDRCPQNYHLVSCTGVGLPIRVHAMLCAAQFGFYIILLNLYLYLEI